MDSPADLAFQQAHIHDDRRAGTLAVNIVSLIIAFASVSLRYLSRRLAGTTFGPDDGWICVAMVRRHLSPLHTSIAKALRCSSLPLWPVYPQWSTTVMADTRSSSPMQKA